MNLKKAKALRRVLRQHGIHPRDTAYKAIVHPPVIGKRAKPRVQMVLDKNCGRSAYNGLKRSRGFSGQDVRAALNAVVASGD